MMLARVLNFKEGATKESKIYKYRICFMIRHANKPIPMSTRLLRPDFDRQN
jgi:hypothetical protein